MTPRDLRNTHPTGNSCRDTLSFTKKALKLPQYFTCWRRSLLAITSKFGLLTIRRHSATRKRLSLYPQGGRSGMKKPKKHSSTLITTTTSIHLPKQTLAWHEGNSPHQWYSLHKSRKGRFAWVMKSLPQYKAAWADITHTKSSVARSELILIDITELILNWFF